MKKIAAILLAILMVALTCTVVMADEVDSSAPDSSALDSSELDSSEPVAVVDSSEPAPVASNVALNKKYTVTVFDAFNNAPLTAAGLTYNAGCVDTDGKLLTDGKVRTLAQLDASGAGVVGTSVEFTGGIKDWTMTIDLDGSFDISSVILGTIRRASNRYVNLVSVKTSADGTSFSDAAFTPSLDLVEGHTVDNQYAVGGNKTDQFFNLTAAFASEIKGVKKVQIVFNTKFDRNEMTKYGITDPKTSSTFDGTKQFDDRVYVAQFDQVMVMGFSAGGGGTGGNTANDSYDNSSAAAGSVNSSKAPSTTPTTGDLGLTVFAILAVISLAGVVVAKKSR